MFCPKCKALMKLAPGGPYCSACGHKGKTKSDIVHAGTAEVKADIPVFEEGSSTLPTTDEFSCPECGHREATFVYRQTRAADEQTTIILQCTKCKHKWRKY